MGHKHRVGHDIAQKAEKILGREQFEPGKPTRHVPENHPPAESAGIPSDVEEIARQQGVSPRGWTGDQPKTAKNKPARFDPKHPGGLPSGDPRR